jgi:hypothetical protein
MADSSRLIGQTISHYRIPKSSFAVREWCTKPRTPNPTHMNLLKRKKLQSLPTWQELNSRANHFNFRYGARFPDK